MASPFPRVVCWGSGGLGVQAIDGNLRERARPDCGTRSGRRPERFGAWALLRTRSQAIWKIIQHFPRVHAKLAWMAAETMLVRQLTYFAAWRKDAGQRCDIEAGMAKLLAARVAFSNADSALQIHGGNGYALESPISRVLCDARILSIFEGAADIEAQVIARGLLERHN